MTFSFDAGEAGLHGRLFGFWWLTCTVKRMGVPPGEVGGRLSINCALSHLTSACSPLLVDRGLDSTRCKCSPDVETDSTILVHQPTYSHIQAIRTAHKFSESVMVPVEDTKRPTRAKVACKLCHARRVRCNAVEKRPCDGCEARGTSCVLVESRRGQ